MTKPKHLSWRLGFMYKTTAISRLLRFWYENSALCAKLVRVGRDRSPKRSVGKFGSVISIRQRDGCTVLARIRPRRVLRAARKREGSGKRITGCDERKVGLIENTACDDVTSLLYSLETKAADDDVHC